MSNETKAPQPPAEAQAVGVEWPLSLLRAGRWREVYVGHRCMRLEVTYDYATWGRLMEQVEAAITQQPAHVAPVGVDAIKSAIAELDALRNAMFKTYAAAANGADKAKLIRLIEAERDAYEAHYSLPKLQEALAQQPAAVDGALRAEVAEWKASYQQAADASLAHAERAERLEEALSHQRWCRTCAEDGWENCEDGRKADALLHPTAALRDHDQEPTNDR